LVDPTFTRIARLLGPLSVSLPLKLAIDLKPTLLDGLLASSSDFTCDRADVRRLLGINGPPPLQR